MSSSGPATGHPGVSASPTRFDGCRRSIRRILLVNPNNEDHASFVILPHLGLGYLAAALKRAGYEVDLWDGLRRGASTDDLTAHIHDHGPYDAVGVSLFTTFIRTAQRYVQAVRREWPSTWIFAGGPHATFEDEWTLRELPEIDALVRGEGEEAFPQLLAVIADGGDWSAIPNLAWLTDDGMPVRTPMRTIRSLDEIPRPNWELLEPDKFRLKPNGIFTRASRIVPMVVTRGCPYECTFCGAPEMTGRPLRRRDVDEVLDEMAWLKDRYGLREFHFMDDNFTLNQPYLREFCRKLIDRRLNVAWACPNGVRLDSLRPDTLELMQESGCYSFAVGIEVGTQRMLEAIKKDLTIERIREQLAMIRGVAPKIRVTGFFILGLPQESEDDVRATIALACSLPLDRANFFNYSPFPGNALYRELKAAGELDDLDFSKVYIHSLAYRHPRISADRLRRLIQWAHLRFYLRPRILGGLVREIHSWSQVEVISRRVLAIMRGAPA